ncbi:MAG: hypothetical protein ABIT01_13405 [Thermoanaerobaculia bacterium]
MDEYSIAWTDSEERVEGPFPDVEVAAEAARQTANLVQRPVRVLRHDGTTLMTIFPAAPTMVSVRRPKA